MLVVLSIGLNITLIVKYDTLGKLRYKMNHFFGSLPTAFTIPTNNFNLPLPLPKNSKPFVSYLVNDSISRLTISSEESKKEIPDQLIIRPRTYNYLGDSYSLNKEGLYRFIRTDQNTGNVQRCNSHPWFQARSHHIERSECPTEWCRST